ncbi:hypothetical protein ACH42_12005 [Endozoicomonas sp. (ex Bugula neritina AB1)]|nr:hypothetical protein ACH42_12005 [Endozoicomonas sp. (ex Bugula neritina AB1)]
MKRLLMIMLVLMPLAGITDQFYRWTDEKGVVHFSSKPLDETQDHELIPLPDVPALTPGVQHSKSTKEETEDAPQMSADAPQPTQEDIEYCNTLTTNINTLKNSPRVRIKREDGTFEILGDEARKAEITRLKKLQNDFC